MSQNNLDDLMKELRADYIASLPQKIAAIEDHFKAKNVPLLRDDFHKLKGTGKTYGLPEISYLGEHLEKICLERPNEISKAVPLALQILNEIYEARKSNRGYSLNVLERFKG